MATASALNQHQELNAKDAPTECVQDLPDDAFKLAAQVPRQEKVESNV